MSWGLVPTAAPGAPPPMSPFSRMTIERDGYGYSSGHKKANHNAALSALALISFLFFLNLLQQQLSSGQQQTLLFMVNNTNTAAQGRKRREVPVTKPPDTGREDDKAEVFQEELVLLRKYLSYDHRTSGTVPELSSQRPIPAPPSTEWNQLATWIRGVVPANTRLHPQLSQVLSDCRDIIACTLYQSKATKHFLDDTVIKAILAATGEFGDPQDIKIDEACEDLMEMSSSDCSDLADTFSILTPSLIKSQHSFKHDDLL